jgi:hypothetical protein
MKEHDAMADLASDAAELYGDILFTTLMVMLVIWTLWVRRRRTYPVIPMRLQVQAIIPSRSPYF